MTRLLSLSLVVALGIVAAARGAADEDLAKAVKKAPADGYAFLINEDPGPGTGGATEAKYQKGKPLWVKADNIEFFRQGDVLVYKDKDAWQRSRTGTVSDPLRVLGGVAKA